MAKVPNPVQCPRCKRVDWREPNKKERMLNVTSQEANGAPEVVLGAGGGKAKEAGRKAHHREPVREREGPPPRSSSSCPDCGGLNGLHQKGCKRKVN